MVKKTEFVVTFVLSCISSYPMNRRRVEGDVAVKKLPSHDVTEDVIVEAAAVTLT